MAGSAILLDEAVRSRKAFSNPTLAEAIAAAAEAPAHAIGPPAPLTQGARAIAPSIGATVGRSC